MGHCAWRWHGLVAAAALALAALLSVPITRHCLRQGAYLIELVSALPAHQLTIAWLAASAVTLITLVAIWAGYSRSHWFWRLSAMAGVLALLGLIEASEPILFALALMTPVAVATWLLRRRQLREMEEGGAANRQSWRWTLPEVFLGFIVLVVVALALRTPSRGELYLVPGAFALTCSVQILVALLAATGGLARRIATRCAASLLTLAVAIGATLVRGPLADDGLGVAYLFEVVYPEPQRSALWIVAQVGIAAVLMLACHVHAVARSGHFVVKRAAGTCLVLIVAAVVVPLGLVYPGMVPRAATVAPLPRSETYDKLQAVGEKAAGFRNPGDVPASLMAEAAAALEEPGHVYFDPSEVRRNDLSEKFHRSFHQEQVLSHAIDMAAARAERAGRFSECLELAILQ